MKSLILIALLLIALTQGASIRMLQTNQGESNDVEVSCSTNADCSNGHLCDTDSGFCSECLQDSDCGSELQCITSSRKCGHICNLHSDCPLNAHCNYATSPYSCTANPCSHDGDCPQSMCQSSEFCAVQGIAREPYNDTDNGNNLPSCSADTDCSSGKFCHQGSCVSCAQDSDCSAAGEICITSTGECGRNCTVHDDCFLNEDCWYTTSPASCHASSCTHDGDCQNSTCDANGFCVVVGLPKTQEDDSDDGNKLPTCSVNADCSSGKFCHQGHCVSCSQNSDCGSGQICISSEGECGRFCGLHADCFLNQHCSFQTSPSSCMPNTCDHDGDCPNSTCTNGFCAVQGLPRQQDSHNETDSGSNSGNGQTCRVHSDCGSNTFCDYHSTPYTCAANPCTHDGDCPGSTCSNGFCVVDGNQNGGEGGENNSDN